MLRQLLLSTFLFGLFGMASHAQNTSPYWSLAGNNNSNTASKLGTTIAEPLNLTTNNVTRLKIATDGSVGIGTTSPQQRLHAEGTSNQAIFVSTTAPGSTSGSGMIGSVKATPTAAGQRLGFYLFGSRGGAQNAYNTAGMVGYAGSGWTSTSRPTYLSFETTPSGSTSRVERVRILANGDIGIGTTTPLARLDVEPVGNGGGIYAKGNDGIAVRARSFQGIGVHAYSETAYGVRAECPQGTGIKTSGQVYGIEASGDQAGANCFSTDGVGLDASSTNASGLVASTSSGTYAAEFNGKVFASAGYVTSDRNLKRNIVEFGNAMDIINELKPLNYEFSNDAKYQFLHLPKGTHYGLMAQDLEQVLPNLVSEGKHALRTSRPTTSSGPASAGGQTQVAAQQPIQSITIKAVNYVELIPIIVKAMQEQNVENGSLKQQVATQQQQLNELRQMVVELKNGRNSTTSISAAYLEQASPNPARGSSTVRYGVPEGTASARLTLTNANGQTLKELILNNRGTGQLSLNTSALPSGTYTYTLWVDGKQVTSKQLVIAR